MNIEKQIVAALKVVCENPKLKAADLMEWSSDGDRVKTRLLQEKEVYVTCSALGMTWHCAVMKTADKREGKGADIDTP